MVLGRGWSVEGGGDGGGEGKEVGGEDEWKRGGEGYACPGSLRGTPVLVLSRGGHTPVLVLAVLPPLPTKGPLT